METREAIAVRIKELCNEKGMTMYRLSALSGVPHTTLISNINGDSKNPGIMTIKKLSDAFGISLAEFFSSELF